MDTQSLQATLRDVAEIKAIINKARGVSKSGLSHPSSSLLLRIHAVIVGAAFAGIVTELLAPPSITGALYLSHGSWVWRFALTIGLTAVMMVLASALYYAVYSAARKQGESFEHYVSRNFVYLSNVSFISDLIVKYVLVSVAVLSGRGDWVAALFWICIGDYLLQGRLFVLPTKIALVLGFAFQAFGIYQLLFLSGTLLYPFVGLLVVCVGSTIYIYRASGETEGREH